MHGGAEGAHPHHVGVDEVDADLEADQVGRGVAYRAGDERVQQGAATEAEVHQFHLVSRCRERLPDGRRARGVGAVADGAAVVQPGTAPGGGAGSTGASVRSSTSAVISLYGSQISTVLSAPGSPSKRTAPAGPGFISASPVDMSTVTVLPPVADACPSRPPVDEQVVQALRAGRGAHVDALGGDGRQLDDGGAGAEDEADAGGLGLGHGELPVGVLRARPGGQTVRQQPVGGLLQVEGAAYEVGGDGGGVGQGRGGHVWVRPSGDTGGREGCGGRAQGAGGQVRSRTSRASRTRDQVS